jgi:hypothetical protein
MPDENSVTFWKSVADTFANTPNVLFDLYNEPHPGSWNTWQTGGTVPGVSPITNSFSTPGFQTLINTVRTEGANNVIIISGMNWAKDLTEISSYPLTETTGYGIMYEAHIYNNMPTTQNAAGWDSYVSVAVNQGYCVTIGEFGPNWSATASGDGGNEVNSGCNPFESQLLTWINGSNDANYDYNATAWSLHPSSYPNLISDWNFDPTTCHGIDVKDWLAGITHPVCVSPTNTPIVSPTPTYTISPVLSPTPTYTITPTYTATPLPTATPIYYPPKGSVIYPNPINYNTNQWMTLKFYLPQDESVVWLRIYTFAYRLIYENYLPNGMNNNTYNFSKGWNSVKLYVPQYLYNAANGIYYYAIYDNSTGSLKQISQTDALVILR